MTNLAPRLEDLPGVASVEIDLDDEAAGIRVRLEPGADEADVTERVHSLLVAYGIRTSKPNLRFRGSSAEDAESELDVEVRITPIRGGARVEVIGKKVRSFRVVPPNPNAIAQGLCDSWCQVIGRIPLEVVAVSLREGVLTIRLTDGDTEFSGSASTEDGLESALALATGRALGATAGQTSTVEKPLSSRI